LQRLETVTSMRLSRIRFPSIVAATALCTHALSAQVVIQPATVTAGAIARFAVQVANLRDVPVAQVRVDRKSVV